MSLSLTSEKFVLEFPSPRHFSLSVSYSLDPSDLGEPTGSTTTAAITLRDTGTHKPFHHSKLQIPMEGL
jgi:hypothetical protein